MPDIDKIVSGIEHCRNRFDGMTGLSCINERCEGCPYHTDNSPGGTRLWCPEMWDDALTILKSHQKVYVKYSDEDGNVETVCGSCGYGLDKKYGNCPKCGRAIKWE